MSTTVQKLKTQIGKLTIKQRVELARFLLDSLDQEAHDEGAFNQKLDRRIREIKSGRARGVPAEQVFARLREKYT